MSEHKRESAANRDSEPFLVLAETRPKPSVKRGFRWRWLPVVAVLVLLACGALAMQFGLFSGNVGSAIQNAAGDLAKKAAVSFAKKAVSDLAKNAENATSSGDPNAVENLVGLALQGVNLFNGEKGAELWRLKASWAHLSQEGDSILVDAPVVRYTMGDPAAEDYLDVKSEKGTVTDGQRYLNLTGNVDVRRMGDVLTGPQMNYDSKTRVMVFPTGARLESERATGDADVFTWDLSTNTMLAEGNVDVLIKPRQTEETVSASEPVSPAPVIVPAVSPTPEVAATPAKKAGAVQKKSSAPKAGVKKAAPKKPAVKKTTATTAKKKTSATQKNTTKTPAATAKKAS